MLRPLRGIPLYVLRLCQSLPALARQTRFVYFINKGFEHNDTPENYQPRINAIEQQNPNVTFVNYDHVAEIKWEQLYLPRLIKEYDVDLLHMPANRACFSPGIPMVITVHDVMEYCFLLDQKYPISWVKNRSLRMLQYNLRRRIYAVLTYRFGIPRASRLISVSRFSADDIATTLSIEKELISVIHHGVDTEYFQESPRPLEDRALTLLLGGDSHQKNPEVALASWAQVDPLLRQKYPLKIIGFCGNDSSPLLQAVRKYGLENSVEILGWVSQQEMVEYFKSAALFLFPSRFEGFGFPLIQAMACGTPIISTDKSSIPEVLGPVGLKYNPDDYTGMASGIEMMLKDNAEWKRQSKIGCERSKQFTWENSAREHLELYKRLL